MNGVLLIGAGLLVFFFGLAQCLTSRKFLGFLFGIELILNAANLNLAGFFLIQPYRDDILPLMLMIMAFAAIELVVGIAVFLWILKKGQTGDFSLV